MNDVIRSLLAELSLALRKRRAGEANRPKDVAAVPRSDSVKRRLPEQSRIRPAYRPKPPISRASNM